MDLQQLDRLKIEQQKAFEETNANIKQWEKFRSDYKSLKGRLKTLPDKLTHDVMVPFGTLAFMPGKLVHTNEILVLLGDNWFVERSAKQACEIVDRRVKAINTEINNLEKQKELLKPRLDAAENFSQSGTFEIAEPYDEEKEKIWREQHKKNVQEYRKSEKKKREKCQGKEISNEEIWERLNQLEKIEAERQEFSKLTGDDALLFQKSYDSDDSIISLETGSNSDDLDTNDPSNHESSSEEGASDDEGSDIQTVTRTIRFKHTSSKQTTSKTISTDSDSEPVKTFIKSPADIFSQFGVDEKSILKNTGQSVTVIDRLTSDSVVTDSDKTRSEVQPVAFSGSVVEKTAKFTSDHTSGSASIDKPVRMSKFKARRQGLDQT